MAVRARLVIRGRVQGVWFRGAMQEEARRLGASGWARNLTNGDVAAEVEGERHIVDDVIAWAHHGPPGARVSDVNVEWIAPQGDAEGTFAIHR
jgi:acylphosphatase